MEKEWNVIPIIKNSKKPSIKWLDYQTKRFPRDDFHLYGTCNYAVIAGKISNNLVIIDFDFEGKPIFKNIINSLKVGFPKESETLITTTPHGLHIYFYIEGECPRRQTQIESPFEEIKHIDILGEGGYALIPPSMIDDGYYLAVTEYPVATINRETFDKIVKFYSKNIDDIKRKPPKESKDISIKLHKFRKPFRDILKGKTNIHTIANQTKKNEFVYWKFLFIEGYRAGHNPEELYGMLRTAQPEFDRKTTEIQLRAQKITERSRKMTEDMMPLYFPDYEPEGELWLKIARQLKKDYDLITMDDSLNLMVKRGNIYTFDLNKFYNDVSRQLEIMRGGKNFSGERQNILTYIKDTTRASRDMFTFDNNIINFKNGYYNLTAKTFIKAEDSKKTFCYEIPHEWKKGHHECPKFIDLLHDWLGENNPVTIEDIFEMMGYSMTMNVSLKKAFFIFGKSHAGKTQFQNILEHVIGHENRASTSLLRMTKNEFGTDGLEFKLLNMIGDMSSATIEDLSAFKILTGGDKYVEAEIKGGKKYQFRNTIKIWYNANFIPKIVDSHDEAFYVRWILINFPNRFPEDADDTVPDVYQTICEDEDEVQGIIKECIEGAKRLLKRGRFGGHLIEHTEHEWKYHSDPIYAFIHDKCILGVDESILATELQNKLNSYLYRKGRRVLSPYKIVRILEENNIHKMRSGSEDEYGKRPEYYTGIGWKPERQRVEVRRF